MVRSPNGDFQRDAVDEHNASGLPDCEAHKSKLLLPAVHQRIPASARGCQSPCDIGEWETQSRPGGREGLGPSAEIHLLVLGVLEFVSEKLQDLSCSSNSQSKH